MIDNNIEVYKKELHIDDEKNYEIVKRTIMTKEQAINFELPKINIITKLAIKYCDNFYMTKACFKFTDNDWFTTRIEEIPDDMLFDNFKEAEDYLLFISEYHSLMRQYLSIDVVRKLEREELL